MKDKQTTSVRGAVRLPLTVGVLLVIPVIFPRLAQAQKNLSQNNFSSLYDFTYGTDGIAPSGGLIPDLSGNLYGVTLEGGNLGGTCPSNNGCGVVYKVSSLGQESVLYAFTGGKDGAFPTGKLVRDSAGNIVRHRP